MHPVLKAKIELLASEISVVSREDLQIRPQPGHGRWSAQEIIEHLILTYKFTSDELKKQLEKGRPPRNRRSLLQTLLRLQTIGFGYMPDGIPSMLAYRPREFTPECGKDLAARFLLAAESMDAQLHISRIRFGIQPCGEHPFYGLMRVDEWRRYHSIHANHHLLQLRNAISFARGSRTREESSFGLPA